MSVAAEWRLAAVVVAVAGLPDTGFQTVSAEPVAPDAAGIQSNDVVLVGAAFQCGPVSEQDFFRDVDPARPGIPGVQMGRYAGEGFLVQQVDMPLCVQQAHAGEEVGDGAPARVPAALCPSGWA